MDKEDARYQTLEQLHERRKQVIRLHKRGIKVMELVQMSGYLIVDLKGRFI
jgi:hypothetical protein